MYYSNELFWGATCVNVHTSTAEWPPSRAGFLTKKSSYVLVWKVSLLTHDKNQQHCMSCISCGMMVDLESYRPKQNMPKMRLLECVQPLPSCYLLAVFCCGYGCGIMGVAFDCLPISGLLLSSIGCSCHVGLLLIR